MGVEAIVALIGLCITQGIPAVTAAIAAWGKEVVTLEDVESLAALIKPPEDY